MDIYHGIPWYATVYHGIRWYAMVYHGIPWHTMVYHGMPWCTMVYHGIQWYTMVYHGWTEGSWWESPMSHIQGIGGIDAKEWMELAIRAPRVAEEVLHAVTVPCKA